MKSKCANNEPLIVVGATMLAFGLASERTEDTLIIEQSASPVPEFAGAFFAGNGPPSAPRSPAGADLEHELTERNILNNKHWHVPALVPVLMRRITEHETRCLFWTDIIDVTPENDGGFEISFFNASGLQKIRTSGIIDTTSGPGILKKTALPEEKSLRAALHGTIEPGTSMELAPETEWQPRGFPNESYFGVKLNPATQWPEARRTLMNAWHNRPKALAQTLIAAIATEFHYPCAPEQTSHVPGIIHLPSAGFADPLAAFEAGVAMAKETS